MDEYPDLTARQQAMYQAYEIITEAFGMFDKSSGPDGAHYMSENDNPFAEEGLMCANCSFYEGGQACEIVKGEIEPMALCKLWVIKNTLIDETVEKGSRSAAGQYAANIRWGGRGADSTAPATNPTPPTTISKDQVPDLVQGLLKGDGTTDLSTTTITGTPFFAPNAGTMSRTDMPQVPTNRKAEFIADVQKKGLTVSHESVDPATLKPTQKDINGKSSAEIMQRETARGDQAFSANPVGSIVVSSDGFVMDGHHRWAAAALSSTMRPTTISIIRIGSPQKELLGVMDKWGKANNIARRGFGDHVPSVSKMLAFNKACDLALTAQKELLNDPNE